MLAASSMNAAARSRRRRSACCFGDPQSPARPAVRLGRGQPLSPKPLAERVGVRWIGEAIANVALFVVMPPEAPAGLDANAPFRAGGVPAGRGGRPVCRAAHVTVSAAFD